MRNISFSKTTEQVRNRTKTVTRRFAWWDLKPGTRLWAVEKSQGLKKGEKIKQIWMIEIVSARKEEVGALFKYPNPEEELAKEGVPDMLISNFANMLCRLRVPHANIYDDVNRIEFKYVE